MAIKAKGRADDDALDDEEIEDADLADDQTEDTEVEEGAEDDDESDKSKGKRKESDVERLQRELDQAKKEARTLRRERNEAKGKLTKAGITDDDDPEDISKELTRLKAQNQKLQTQQREVQVERAIRRVLDEDERLSGYAKSLKYIAVELDLTEDDLDPDTGKYDTDALEEAAERAVARFAKNAPRQSVVAHRASAGGEPGRGGQAPKKSEKDKLAEMDDALGGVFSKYGMIQR
jgi:hypothetical protein